ncbi:50S ribosomal protein L11 methyltransferase [Radicibacter daui]|uniref:50S ribosomal protein L11 methyltransferase n=1 Tax=Radicibacter daui TaxID=3064829 RepID=UPI004046D4C7
MSAPSYSATPYAGWRLEFIVPGGFQALFSEALEEDMEAVSAFEAVPDGSLFNVQGFSRSKPDDGAIGIRLSLLAAALGLEEPAIELTRIEDTDWLRATYEAFPPKTIERFWIHGSHVTEALPAGKTGLLVDAATAFGSGDHPSTEGCLRALDKLARRVKPSRVLDMGCGSGILGMAAAKLWRLPTDAVDIDPESVRVTQENARLNGVTAFMTAETGPGYNTPLVRGRRYDIIFANILARPLCRMAPQLSAHLAPGGHGILAGLLTIQVPMVLAAHRAAGLHLAFAVPMGEWTTLVVAKRAR